MSAPNIRIFLIRHGLSEANMDKTVNARKPDHAVELAGDVTSDDPEENGHAQAFLAGKALVDLLLDHNPANEQVRSLIGDNPQKRRVRLLVSPYTRTRQTAEGIKKALADEDIVFDEREVMELREISFGLYDGIEDDLLAERFPAEHAHYQKHVEFEGELFAPMPMGESRIAVGDRVKSVFGTILRDAQPRERDDLEKALGQESLSNGPILDFVIVSHGVTIRQFVHRWMHYPWEWVEKEPNPANCSIQLIERATGGGYTHCHLYDGFRHLRGHEKQERREDGHALD